VESKKKRNKVGRPVGDAGRIQEFKARLLSTTGTKVIDTVLRKALDDTDKDQVACLKMCLDRMLPTSLFEKDAKGQRNAVTINITGLGETKVEAVEEPKKAAPKKAVMGTESKLEDLVGEWDDA
jgi:hypothetical protein